MEQGRCEEVGQVDLQALTQLVNNTEFHGWIGSVDKIADGGFRNAAFHIELIRRHASLAEQFGQSFADGFVQLHSLSLLVHGTVPTVYV